MTPKQLILVVFVGAYIALGRLLVRSTRRGRDVVFGLLTLVAVFSVFFTTNDANLHYSKIYCLFFIAYVAFVSVQYLALRNWGGRADW